MEVIGLTYQTPVSNSRPMVIVVVLFFTSGLIRYDKNCIGLLSGLKMDLLMQFKILLR